MKLPGSRHLPIHLLASCFNNTVATYKFYWFLSILHAAENGETKIQKKDLFASMVANAWYTVNYFHLSFGKQDKLQRGIERIKTLEAISIDEDRQAILSKLRNAAKETLTELRYFDSQVPHWFLSPWFRGLNRGEIYTSSKSFANQSLYALYDEHILINPEWVNYLIENVHMLKAFCYWNLAIFLQAKNPNVPDIPNKLIKPAARNSLTKQRKEFWDIVIDKNGPQHCIYTRKPLYKDDYAVEHFIPYAFVSHDLIWNLIPADKSFNSSKGDRIPPFDIYFDDFFQMQIMGIDTVRKAKPIFDKFPVSTGHALIIPNRHTSSYFDLSPEEQSYCMQLLNEVKQMVTEQFSPDGFNVGINVHEAAGQTVPHVHIHLIPRYHGDVANPLGGVRGVIPDKKEY
jgi:diadenosine tetraphosphate (Ap4A) HIT family hydrolase